MDPASVILFIFLFALSAFFSGSEIAFMSLGSHQIDSFVKQRKPGARTLRKLRENTEKLLITILIGNNLVNVITASFATKISIDIAEASGAEQSLAIGISTGVITLLLLLFGEIFPKTIATRYAAQISLRIANFYKILQYIIWPIVVSVEWLMQIMQKKGTHVKMSDEEVEAFIDMSKEHGALEKKEYEGIKNMLDFYEVTAEEIMTPRVKMDALDCQITLEEALEQLVELSHSRIPVYCDSIDNIVGIVTLRELLIAKKEGKQADKLIHSDFGEAIKIPLNKPIHKILDLFQKSHRHIAIVMDEYGGVAGLITLEDIIEEVFGEIQDETDKEVLPIKKHEGKLVVQSFVRFEEILDALKIDFSDINISEEEFEGETMSYFITSYLERFPYKDEKISLVVEREEGKNQKLIIYVTKLEDNVIEEVEVELV